MSEIQNSKPIDDLDERTYRCTRDVRLSFETLDNSTANEEAVRQVIKSPGSIGAKYRETSLTLSKKDFLWKIRIARKESKKAGNWLTLIMETNDLIDDERASKLINESIQLKKIFSSLIRNQNSWSC